MNPLRKALIGGALAAATLTGGALGATLVGGTAGAASNPTATTTASTGSSTLAPPANAPGKGPANAPDPSKGGHQANGITEKLLTGTTKAKAEAAAKAAVSGGTVERSETDAEGAAYEVHMTKSDGSHVTVKLDSSFKVTSTEAGPR